MTRFIHDKFAKDYLEELLKDYGEVKASEKVSGEIKEIDVLFTPAKQKSANLQILGLLGRLAEHPAIIEPYRNPASSDEICDCILKLLEIKALLRREAKANKIKLQESEIPKLWILTPTISETRLSSFGTVQKQGWLSGIHFLADALRTVIVAIHQLPQTPETLWLRLLGRGSVQSQAIIELQALPLDHPYQKATLELVYNLRENLRVNQELEADDRELIMRLEPLYQRDREKAKEEGIQQGIQQGRQEGIQEGRQEGEKDLIMRLLNRRIGEIDALLIERISGLSIEQLENLGEALLDFSSVADLETWLTQHSI
ncbi:DUF4351 domain-containing protein [Nodularia spumigena CS-584]|jgi:hypothetical protein|uniref:DUF4351 domain-containing protein n=2 Tax=Nodularia spumigena TaxID=70799 RepID=A0ABU5UMJ1_NODSP|nr:MULTISPECIES: DUF4351 domain-containing protein [Cyanophyceae]MDB9358008.1 DUF4351 domain-containing protein [Nodularia spumigena CS-587/03]AHJ27886.1 hypothetical protein NSP_15520 [Nodularia spumigena CCY9414]EAW43896.1 hypothetical protein N9414_09521 [Nodularia spumigena CCY9414]MDB9341265.1 DUF4351 domain-containing protein [Nodularia spumigena CS-589/07]MDB9382658.1 DUF4351 domain-containing protein [Nodularia spumigena CS-584]